jgi:hypothetical protein
MRNETQRYPLPTLEEWDGMLRRYPEGPARALYALACAWRDVEPQEGRVVKLMQHAEAVLAERFPDLKRPS